MLTKTSIVDDIVQNSSMTRVEANKLVTHIITLLSDTLKSRTPVNIRGFGKFGFSEFKERWGVNPNTKERLKISARTAVKFTPCQALKKL